MTQCLEMYLIYCLENEFNLTETRLKLYTKFLKVIQSVEASHFTHSSDIQIGAFQRRCD